MAEKNTILSEVLKSLSMKNKWLPSKLHYDDYGSQLFEQICKQDDYYVTRTEMEIMRQNIEEMVTKIGSACALLEFGSGNSKKTRFLLKHLNHPSIYIPIDISQEILFRSANELQRLFPSIEIIPLCADYLKTIELPTPKRKFNRKVMYFPGSTIGNFNPKEAEAFLKRIRECVGARGALLIGVDLEKDKKILEKAYSDKKGITSMFNLNMLTHINHLCDANFDINKFKFKAFYNEREHRIEAYLMSLEKHAVQIGEIEVSFEKNEAIRTEYSYKYSLESFKTIAQKADFHVDKTWVDDKNYFSVQLLV